VATLEASVAAMDAKVAVLGAGIATLEATIDAKVASLAAAIQEFSVQLKTLMSFLLATPLPSLHTYIVCRYTPYPLLCRIIC